jgi:hypothetical protein
MASPPCSNSCCLASQSSGTVPVSVLREGDSDQYSLVIAPAAKLPVGPFEAELVVTIVDPDGKRLDGGRLSIAGTVQPAIRLLPAAVLLGTGTVGEVAEGVVVLQVPDGVEFQVAQIETSSSDVRAEPTEIPGIASGRAFRIIQNITAIGDNSTDVCFVIRRGQEPTQRVKTEIKYHGRKGS